jgi:polar amino acid transport system ATP-binding protein
VSTLRSPTPKIRIEDLTKYYGQTLVLDEVDLDVAEHEVVCLIGASGSGKSTLLRCINLLVPFDHGRILLDGVSVDDPSFGRNGLCKRVGIVFQAFNLFPHMDVLDNITLAPRRVHGGSAREAETRAHELLARLDLGGFERAYPEQLSGGQQQRVAIVRALATNPDVLLLDEVTAALDPELVGGVLDVIRELKARHDDGDRHPRDGLRPRRGRPGRVPRRRSHRRGGAPQQVLAAPAGATHPSVPAAHHRRRTALRVRGRAASASPARCRRSASSASSAWRSMRSSSLMTSSTVRSASST